MRRVLQLICLFAALVLPASASGQGTIVAADIDTYVTLLNAECPIKYHEAWAVNSIEAEGDTVYAVLQTPSSLAGFLSMLTGEGDNVVRMWLRQLKNFGYPWIDLIDRLTDEGRYLVITIQPENSRTAAQISVTPEILAAFAENDVPSPPVPEEEEPVEDEETPLDE